MAAFHLPRAQCNHCGLRGVTLRPCTDCDVVNYCCKDHQAADWTSHKSRCSAVEEATAILEKEERKLRNHPGNGMMPANPFDHPGRFSDWDDTRSYIVALLSLVGGMRDLRTYEALDRAYFYLMDILRLDRKDALWVRHIVPALLLQLRKDREAYDFMEWWATGGNHGRHSWSYMNLPFPVSLNEDAFESLTAGDWTGKSIELGTRIFVTLLKYRLLLDLYSLQTSMKDIVHHLPQELVDLVRQHLTSDIVAGNAEISQRMRDGISIQAHIENVESQLNPMFQVIDKANQHFWSALAGSGSYSFPDKEQEIWRGSIEAGRVQVGYAYGAWEETPGAIDWVRKKLGQAKLQCRNSA